MCTYMLNLGKYANIPMQNKILIFESRHYETNLYLTIHAIGQTKKTCKIVLS